MPLISLHGQCELVRNSLNDHEYYQLPLPTGVKEHIQACTSCSCYEIALQQTPEVLLKCSLDFESEVGADSAQILSSKLILRIIRVAQYCELQATKEMLRDEMTRLLWVIAEIKDSQEEESVFKHLPLEMLACVIRMMEKGQSTQVEAVNLRAYWTVALGRK